MSYLTIEMMEELHGICGAVLVCNTIAGMEGMAEFMIRDTLNRWKEEGRLDFAPRFSVRALPYDDSGTLQLEFKINKNDMDPHARMKYFE